jgi:polar amino acid transport system ATP-binding protein
VQVTLTNVTKKFVTQDKQTQGVVEQVVLNQVSLTVDAGETVALIGPSGGGKSTILRCINGLCSFDAGEIRVGEHTLRPNQDNKLVAPKIRKYFGMVFQDFQLFPHLTALENTIEAPIRVLKMDRVAAKERGKQLLKRFGLTEEQEKRYPNQLSGGQKQRVAIARALAMEPRGLLCDEITSALDPELKKDALALLEDLKRDGLTMLVVTHEIGFARRAADCVAMLDEGSIIEQGPPGQVLDAPQTERTKKFLSDLLV